MSDHSLVLCDEDITTKLKNCSLDNSSVNDMREKRKIYDERLSIMKTSKELGDINHRVDRLLQKQKKLETKHIQISSEIENVTTQINDLKESIQNIPKVSVSKDDKLDLQRRGDESIRIKYMKQEMSEQLVLIPDSSFEDDELCSKMKKLHILESQQDIVAEYLNYIKELKAYEIIRLQIEDLQKNETEYINRLEALSHILIAIIKAENIAIMECISQINAHAKLYLDAFFREPISVKLASFKQIKGNSKPQINLNFFYQSTRDYNLSDMSGGERDRVMLAFTLALAEISNPSLVLLDECISSLDHYTCVKVVDAIKKHFPGNIIFVAHQISTGIFDTIVEI